MAVAQQKVKIFVSGTHNMLPDEEIPPSAASRSLAWLTVDGHIEISRGRQAYGQVGGVGKNYAEHTAYQANGTPVRFRKVNGDFQYFRTSDSTWVTTITGLTATADYVVSNYSSLAGAFAYVFGVDGIYKIATANPGNYASMYDATKNFKGFAFIDKGRSILWGRAEDPTGLYGSYIDAQDSTVYTTVTNESIGSSGSTTYSGTLAFKGGGARRTCFGVTIDATVAAGTETFTDNFNGVLTSNFGGTGTINYMTGAYSVTFSDTTTGAVTADYQWEDSNNKGVTDFSKSSTRLAGEGFVVRQDAFGTAIRVVIPLNGSYFSMKANCSYRFALDAADENPINEIFRTDIGVSSLRSAIGTGQGIVFINTANALKPKLEILKQNPLGDNFDVKQLFPQFKFENYEYDDALLDTWDQFVIIGCKQDSAENNRLLLGNIPNKTIDATYYGIRTSTKLNGILHGGDPLSQTTFELFTGFDDFGQSVDNYWESKGETYGSDVLKKVKRARFKGLTSANQRTRVEVSYDDGDFTQIGMILGTGDYVDYSSSFAVGTIMVGGDTVGGGDTEPVYSYLMEIRFKGQPKFRKRKFRFVCEEIGYFSVEQITDFDIWTYQEKLPPKYRQQQNVSLDGVPNQPYP